MLFRHRGAAPHIDASAFVAPTAVLAGKVRLEARCRVLYGAVLDAEGAAVEVGESSIISENAVLRATASSTTPASVEIGDHVLVGPHATLLGCTTQSCSFVATGATVLHHAVVKKGSVVAVGALVHAETVIPEGFFVPPNATALGDPVKLYGSEDNERLVAAIKSLRFSEVAFGIESKSRDRASVYYDVAEVRSHEYAAHFDDELVGPGSGSGTKSS